MSLCHLWRLFWRALSLNTWCLISLISEVHHIKIVYRNVSLCEFNYKKADRLEWMLEMCFAMAEEKYWRWLLLCKWKHCKMQCQPNWSPGCIEKKQRRWIYNEKPWNWIRINNILFCEIMQDIGLFWRQLLDDMKATVVSDHKSGCLRTSKCAVLICP